MDTQELRQLLDAHGAALLLYARQWCHAPDDALQEALIELLRQRPAPDRPVAWLFTAIRRRAMNWARGEQRRARHHRQAAVERPAWFLDDHQSPFEPGELEGMLTRLPALEREIVVARIWGELPFEQIAELVACSVSAVHRRYQRAIAVLGSMLDEKLDKSR
jgi:RNA polymerase sigma factor (sigma-70 family)